MKNLNEKNACNWIAYLNVIGLSNINSKFLIIPVFLLILFPAITVRAADSSTKIEHNWHLTAAIGTLLQNNMDEIVLQRKASTDSNYLVMLALARDIYKSKKWIGIELEGQIAKHFGDDNDQWEFLGLAVGRWYPFPWDRYIDTSFGAGAGLSYYTKISKTELAKNDDAQNLLLSLMLELTFGLPQYPKWNLDFRLHHRSGANSIIGESGSNYLCGGVRFTF
ncbi:MAG: acyloxyacyl hydrolase [Desulfobacterales bacterium]|jgi:hypothetical protein